VRNVYDCTRLWCSWTTDLDQRTRRPTPIIHQRTLHQRWTSLRTERSPRTWSQPRTKLERLDEQMAPHMNHLTTQNVTDEQQSEYESTGSEYLSLQDYLKAEPERCLNCWSTPVLHLQKRSTWEKVTHTENSVDLSDFYFLHNRLFGNILPAQSAKWTMAAICSKQRPPFHW